MRILSRTLALFALLLAVAIAPSARAADRTDLVATAKAFAIAYGARDVVAMAELVNSNNTKMFRELAEQGENHRDYEGIFSGWRWKYGSKWSDASGEVRYRRDQALVLVSEIADDEVAVLVFTSEDGLWGLEDIHSPSKSSWEGYSPTPPE